MFSSGGKKEQNGCAKCYHFLIGAIHKPRGQIFGIFDSPSPSWALSLNKGLCRRMVICLTPHPSTVPVVEGWSHSHNLFLIMLPRFMHEQPSL